MMIRTLKMTTAFVGIACLVGTAAIAEGDTKKVIETGKNAALDKIDDLVGTAAENLTNGRIKHLQVSVTEDDWKIGGDATAVIGLSETASQFTFTQLSASRRHERTTINAGLGYRQYNNDETAIIGANIFADNEVSTGHQRAGFGLEFLSLSGSLHFNHYARTSGQKTVKGVVEKAMSGSDLAYHYHFHDLPYQPSVSVRGFEWKGDGNYKVSGTEYGVSLAIAPQTKLTVFHKDESKSKAETRAQLSYVIPFGTSSDEAPAIGVADTKQQLQQLMYQPVKRQNHIKKTTVNLGIVFTTG